jgi:hypothetical protein
MAEIPSTLICRIQTENFALLSCFWLMEYTKITVHCLCLIDLRDKFRIPACNSWFSINTNPTGKANVRILLLNILQEYCLWKIHLPYTNSGLNCVALVALPRYNPAHLTFCYRLSEIKTQHLGGLHSYNVHIKCSKNQSTGSHLKTQKGMTTAKLI